MKVDWTYDVEQVRCAMKDRGGGPGRRVSPKAALIYELNELNELSGDIYIAVQEAEANDDCENSSQRVRKRCFKHRALNEAATES